MEWTKSQKRNHRRSRRRKETGAERCQTSCQRVFDSLQDLVLKTQLLELSSRGRFISFTIEKTRELWCLHHGTTHRLTVIYERNPADLDLLLYVVDGVRLSYTTM
jgi:hypothetical protein